MKTAVDSPGTMIAGDALRILKVEDDDDHAEMVTRALVSLRVTNRIHWVGTGEAALDYVFRRGPYVDPYLSPTPTSSSICGSQSGWAGSTTDD